MKLQELMEVISGKCLYTLSENDQAIRKYDFVKKYSKTENWTKEVESAHTLTSGDMTLFIITLKEV